MARGKGGVSPSAALPLPVVSRVSGGRDLWSAPLSSPPGDPRAAAWQALSEVLDPEIPVSLVDLGLVYGLDWRDGVVDVRITYTATACPCMEFIREDVTDRLMREPWIREVRIHEVWSPQWTAERISAEGRGRLRILGISA